MPYSVRLHPAYRRVFRCGLWFDELAKGYGLKRISHLLTNRSQMEPCKHCCTLIYDVLQDPYPKTSFGGPFIRQKRIEAILPELTAEVYRMIKERVLSPKSNSIPVLMCVDVGLAPPMLCQYWFFEKLRSLRNLHVIHREHSRRL